MTVPDTNTSMSRSRPSSIRQTSRDAEYLWEHRHMSIPGDSCNVAPLNGIKYEDFIEDAEPRRDGLGMWMS